MQMLIPSDRDPAAFLEKFAVWIAERSGSPAAGFAYDVYAELSVMLQMQRQGCSLCWSVLGELAEGVIIKSDVRGFRLPGDPFDVTRQAIHRLMAESVVDERETTGGDLEYQLRGKTTAGTYTRVIQLRAIEIMAGVERASANRFTREPDWMTRERREEISVLRRLIARDGAWYDCREERRAASDLAKDGVIETDGRGNYRIPPAMRERAEHHRTDLIARVGV